MIKSMKKILIKKAQEKHNQKKNSHFNRTTTTKKKLVSINDLYFVVSLKLCIKIEQQQEKSHNESLF